MQRKCNDRLVSSATTISNMKCDHLPITIIPIIGSESSLGDHRFWGANALKQVQADDECWHGHDQ